jgi:hypothetical protein
MYKTLLRSHCLQHFTRPKRTGEATRLLSAVRSRYLRRIDQWKTDFSKLLAIELGEFYRSFQRK